MVEKLDLATLNTIRRGRFTVALADVFEHSAWIAEQAFDARPFADVDALYAALVRVVKRASREAQLTLLRAHPELAGQEAQTGDLTAASTEEQAGAGLKALTAAEMARITELNADYQHTFGFPFIVAVRKHTKQSIFAEWERRLANDTNTELATCLEQVFIIARLRLDGMFEG